MKITNSFIKELTYRNFDFFAWCKEAFTPHYRIEIYEYLLQSEDLDDAQRKIRLIEQRGMI